MWKPTYCRSQHIRALWGERLWSRWLTLAWGAIGVFIVLRDEIFQPSDEQRWRIINMIPHLPFVWWLFGFAVILIIWVFEASFRSARKLHDRIGDLERAAASPLEIIFDPSNPSKRFWSTESPRDEHGQLKPGIFLEYRVEVKNNSQKTVRNVSVTTEHIGQQLPIRPAEKIFDKIKKTSCDINPGCTELAPVIRWPIPKVQAGMLAGALALEYGPVKVTASGDDSEPAIRMFRFDYQAEPMLFD